MLISEDKHMAAVERDRESGEIICTADMVDDFSFTETVHLHV